jgi:death on curing protein
MTMPRLGRFGTDAYPTLAAKAGALMHSLAGNHALVDGSKRLALLATVVFLRINGHRLDLTDLEAFDLTVSVAAGQLDAAGIEKRLRLAPVTA